MCAPNSAFEILLLDKIYTIYEDLSTEHTSLLNLDHTRARRGGGGKDRKAHHSNKHTSSKQRSNHQGQPPQIRPRDKSTVHLDGSTLEGGGQLVRVALTLSAITRIPVHITHIRAGRGGGPRGGLKESHLAALLVLAEECDAAVEGGYVGSRELLFEPAKRQRLQQAAASSPNAFGVVPVTTATRTIALQNPGSVFLILQALLPWYLVQPPGQRLELTLRGGTNVSSSMSADYVQQVLLPALRALIGCNVQLDVVERGWAGNAPHIGEVRVSICTSPTMSTDAMVVGDGGPASNAPGLSSSWPAFTVQPRPVDLNGEAREHGMLSLLKIAVTVIAHPEGTRRALVSRVTEELARRFPHVPVEIFIDEDSGDARRLYILLVAHPLGACRMGTDYLGTGKTVRSVREGEALVEGAAREVVRKLYGEVESGGVVDEFLQDQLVVFQALARGRSVVRGRLGRRMASGEDEDDEGTFHTRTVRWVCGEMLGRLGCVFERGGVCMGVGERGDGLENPSSMVGAVRGTRVEDDTNEQLAQAVSQLDSGE